MIGVLPLDPEEMNEQRASAAKRALLHFARDFGETDADGDLADFSEQNLSDLLVDLAHYCDREGLSLLECFLRAGRCYAEETDDSGMQFKRYGKIISGSTTTGTNLPSVLFRP